MIGVPRAAACLAVLWAVAVIVPSMANDRLSALVQPASMPGWAVLAAVAAVVVTSRRNAYRHLVDFG